MKTTLIASVLIATSFAASAMSHDYQIWPQQQVASGPGLTRAQVIAEMVTAKEAGEINFSDHDIRQAERQSLQAKSTLTRQQVKQELVASRERGEWMIQDHN